MKSTDKFVLVLVASLALLLAGCGGGSSTPAEPEGPTPEEIAEMEAMQMRAMEQKADLEEANDDLDTALAATLNTQDALDAANAAHMALAAAIEAAADVSAADKAIYESAASAAMVRIEDAQKIFDAAEAERMAMEEEQRKMEEAARAAEMTKVGKALKAALGNTPLSNLDLATNPASLTSAGLTVGLPADPSGTPAAAPSPRMKAGASAGSLGDWAGNHYSHTNTGTKVSNSAVVYTNRGTPRSRLAATAFATTGVLPSNATYTAATGALAFISGTADSNIAGDGFADAGTTTHTPAVSGTNIQIPGTYMGAAGTYICDTAAACSSAAGGAAGITLTGAWTFVHNVGAMTSEPDANYLYFGWWLQKDSDGPTSASAFTGVVGSIQGDGTTALAANPNAISGKATYTGGAAGKFAISDPLNGGDGGHFTADATLSATFGAGATAGLTGTLDNFMANDKAVPWSVSLMRRTWDGTTAGLTAQPPDDADTSGVDESMVGTVWSIDGNSAAASGGWTAQMYDEMPGTAPTGDGSNVPTTVTGTFQSAFGSVGSMVGAFGAEKE